MSSKLYPKKVKIAPSLAAILVTATALLSSCQKDGMASSDGAVRFGARIRNEVPTRTSYSGVYYDAAGNEVTTGLTGKFERIDWTNGDRIRVYSPEAVRRGLYEKDPDAAQYHWADYEITSHRDSLKFSNADLKILDNDGGYDEEQMGSDSDGNSLDPGNGLFWDGASKATFYAVYPAPTDGDGNLTDEGTGTSGITGLSGAISGAIPATQTLKNGKCDLSKALMTAVSKDISSGAKVPLDFYPAFTAFQFSLTNSTGQDLTIESLSITSTEAIAGTFTVTLTSGSASYNCTSATSKTVTLSLGAKAFLNGSDLSLTLLALPKDIPNLTLTLRTKTPTSSYSDKVLELKKNSQWLEFGKCKKHLFTGVALDDGLWTFKTITLNGEAVEWVAEEFSTESDNIPQAGQFAVTGDGVQNVYQLHPEDGKSLRQNWVLGSSTATVSFKIFSPAGGTWEIEPQGETSKFLVNGASPTTLSGSISERGEALTKVSFTVTPNGAAAGERIWFKTFVTKDGVKYSLDSETQLYDARGFHYFRVDDPLQ